MKRLPIFAALLLHLSALAQPAQLPVNCSGAIPACTEEFQMIGTNPAYNTPDFGTGTISNPSTNPNPGNTGCLLSGETVSTFFEIQINSSGNLQWSAIAQDASGNPSNAGCIDWILWNVSNQPSSCAGINNNTLPPVACNWNGMCNGNTGMAAAANYPPAASPASYEQPLTVLAGEKYILCLSNYSGTMQPVELSFFGTAGISCGVDAPDQAACGSSGTLVTIATPGYDSPEFTWLNTTGVSDPNGGTNVTVTPTATTTYEVAVYQAPVGGLQELYDTAVFTIFVETPVTAATSLTGTAEICPGSTVEGFPAQDVQYQWLMDGMPVAGATNQTLHIDTAGNYALVVENSCGTDTSEVFTIELIPPVVAGMTPSGPLQFCTGDSVVLEGTPATGVTYEWQLDGQTVADSVSGTFTATVAGTYSVIVANACTSDTALVIVTEDQPLEASLDIIDDTLSICDGSVVVLGALPADATSYVWLIDGNEISGAGTAYFDAYDAGNYMAVVANTCGSDTTAALTLIVNVPPQAPVIVVDDTHLGIDPGSVSGGGEYQWYFDGNEIPGATADTIVPFGNGMYTVTVTDENGCQSVSAAFEVDNVGIGEQADLFLLIAPNPTNGVFTVHFKQGSLGSLTLCDAQGKAIAVQLPEQQADQVVFDLAEYADGVYLLHAEGTGTHVVERIVLNR